MYAHFGLVVLGGGALTSLQASADVRLPTRSAAQLLVDLQTAQLDGVSGTVVERADLGLPALPANFGGTNGADLTSLVTGTNTMRVWYSGRDKARVALTNTDLRNVPEGFRVIPGMTLAGDIHVGTRSVFMYIVSGAMRGMGEAMREP